ncbi:MAG: CPBP family intramembrane metalloprotease [Promethearchaeota archaeon]|nr:MAG: CPBP family intramembrane metalloprotease [Candidatus Lokiarchaeota archaeon]
MNYDLLKRHNKDILIIVVVLSSLIPLFFGYNVQNIIIFSFNSIPFLYVISGIVLLFLLGRIIFSKIIDEKSISKMKGHELIESFINKNEKWVKWVIFPLTMVMEELLFRFYAIIVIIDLINLNSILAILISSSIFSIYHIHFWFRYHDFRIFLSYLILSFFLGVLNGYVFIHNGLIPCVLIHYGMAFELYFYLYRKFYAESQKR